MNGHDPQMLKGVLGLLLLELCCAREDYGYSIVVRLREQGFPELAEGTVYPALTRLEGAGLLSARLVRSSSGPARKYYAATEAGGLALVQARASWDSLVAAVSDVRSAAASDMASSAASATASVAPGDGGGTV